MNILEFIKPELIILIAVLYIVGIAIKKSSIKDKYIPTLIGVVGMLLAIIYVLATSLISTYQDGLMAIFVGITQGILCAGCSVYANQIFKQFGQEE